jgi:hypothetical protein
MMVRNVSLGYLYTSCVQLKHKETKLVNKINLPPEFPEGPAKDGLHRASGRRVPRLRGKRAGVSRSSAPRCHASTEKALRLP